jgi:hypothetical protein
MLRVRPHGDRIRPNQRGFFEVKGLNWPDFAILRPENDLTQEIYVTTRSVGCVTS